MLGALFVASGAQAVFRPDPMVQRAKRVTDRVAPLLERVDPRIPTDARSLVRINGAVQLVSGALLPTRLHRPAALALIGSLVPTTVAGHAFWDTGAGQPARAERIQFMKNVSIVGGLILAAVDSGGRPTLLARTSAATRGRPGLLWRADALANAQPGMLWRARSAAIGRPGLAWRARHRGCGLAWRARHLTHDAGHLMGDLGRDVRRSKRTVLRGADRAAGTVSNIVQAAGVGRRLSR